MPQLCSYGAYGVWRLCGRSLNTAAAWRWPTRMLCGVYRRSFRPSGVKGKLDKKAVGLADCFFYCLVRNSVGESPTFPVKETMKFTSLR